MFHWQNNWFFGRRHDGSVRVLHFESWEGDFPDVDTAYPEAAVDIEIDDSSWASIVSTVSARNETGETFSEALTFHNLTT